MQERRRRQVNARDRGDENRLEEQKQQEPRPDATLVASLWEECQKNKIQWNQHGHSFKSGAPRAFGDSRILSKKSDRVMCQQQNNHAEQNTGRMKAPCQEPGRDKYGVIEEIDARRRKRHKPGFEQQHGAEQDDSSRQQN